MNDYMDEDGIVKELDPYFSASNIFGPENVGSQNIIIPEEIKEQLKETAHIRYPGATGPYPLNMKPHPQSLEDEYYAGNPLPDDIKAHFINGNIEGEMRPIGPGEYLSVDVPTLQLVAASLKKKAELIETIYKDQCAKALSSGSQCLNITGMDCNSLIQKLSSIYTNAGTRLKELAAFIENDVVSNYDSVANTISNKFNGELSTEINKILQNNE